jgi:hypothetical protein
MGEVVGNGDATRAARIEREEREGGRKRTRRQEKEWEADREAETGGCLSAWTIHRKDEVMN